MVMNSPKPIDAENLVIHDPITEVTEKQAHDLAMT